MLARAIFRFPKINHQLVPLYMIAGVTILTSLVLGGVDTGWTPSSPLCSHLHFYLNTHVLTTAVGVAGWWGFSSIFHRLNFTSSPIPAPAAPG